MPSPITRTVSARQLKRFASHGYLVLPGLIPTATIERLRADTDTILRQLIDEMTQTQTPNPRVTWWRLAGGQPYVLKIRPVIDLAASVCAVADAETLCTVVADLLDTRPHLMDNKVMYKQVVDIAADWAGLPVLGEEVRKHTDAAYFSARGFHRVLTVAVCLDECTETAGALKVWPGTHHRDIAMTDTDHQGPVVPDAEAPDAAAVTLAASAGTVLVWDSALVHASGPNTTGRPRRLLVLGYSPTDPAER
jgi:hypothetical protein